MVQVVEIFRGYNTCSFTSIARGVATIEATEAAASPKKYY